MNTPANEVALPDKGESPTPLVSKNENRINVFVGRFGLRAGWGIAIYFVSVVLSSIIFNVVILAATGRSVEVVARYKAHNVIHKPLGLAHQVTTVIALDSTAISAVLGLAGVAFASWLLSLIERRRIGVYGIGRLRLTDFLLGSLSGLTSLSLLIGLLSAGNYLVFDSRALNGPIVAIYGIAWLITYLIVGLLEEYLNRGYLQYTLTRGLMSLGERVSATHSREIAFGIAAVAVSTLFAAGHLFNPGESAVGIIATFLLGIVFSYALWRTGSLWWAIGFHMFWDWAQSFLFSVPDSGALSAGRLFQSHPRGDQLLSGGSVGPEGSLLVIPTLLLVMLTIRIFTRPDLQPPLKPRSRIP